jgi:hypothetical protein
VSDAAETPPPEEPTMEIHKPKPIHNWREFLTEIGVVVLGVCIALAAEQAVEAIHWHDKVVEARGVIATELAGNVSNALERMGKEACGERRLDTLAQILDSASRTGRLPPVGSIGWMPLRQWTSGAWDGVMASQTVTHFPRLQLTNLAFAYGYIRKADMFIQPEIEAWTDLNAMVGPGRRLDPAAEDRLRTALGRARYYNRTISVLGMRIVQMIKRQDITFSPDDLARINKARSLPPTADVEGICLPIGAAPAAYGQAPLAASQNMIDTELKHLPDFNGN